MILQRATTRYDTAATSESRKDGSIQYNDAQQESCGSISNSTSNMYYVAYDTILETVRMFSLLEKENGNGNDSS